MEIKYIQLGVYENYLIDRYYSGEYTYITQYKNNRKYKYTPKFLRLISAIRCTFHKNNCVNGAPIVEVVGYGVIDIYGSFIENKKLFNIGVSGSFFNYGIREMHKNINVKQVKKIL